MKFTKLKISGFKSFVDPTYIDIRQGLTGLVGPNGCGKSNIVEAIKWNMGESGPKNLRAGEMDDVIFAGTRGRASRNFAEVVVSIENNRMDTTNNLLSDEEINISRKIVKNEGSIYRINDKEVRQRDVQILFADQSTGSKSNAIVDQGQIGKIINSKPEDRRKILEEAAGISGVHARRHETELKLKSTEANLLQLSELLESDKIRLKELLRQANQAKNYKSLSNKIRNLEAEILYHKLKAAKDKVKINKEKVDQVLLEVDKTDIIRKDLELEKSKLESQLPQLRLEEQEITQELNQLELKNKLLESDSNRIKENKDVLKQNIQNLEYEIGNEKEIKIKISKQLNNLKKIINNKSKEDSPQKIKLQTISNQLENAKKEQEKYFQLLNNSEKSLSENISKRKNIDLLLQQEQINFNNTSDRIKNYSIKLSNIEKSNNSKEFIESITILIKNFSKDIEKYKENEKLLYDKVAKNKDNIEKLNIELEEKNEDLNVIQRELDKSTASEKLLNDLLENNNTNTILKSLNYPDEFEKAIESALGHGIKASLDEGPIIWHKMKRNNFIPLSSEVKSLANYFTGIEQIENILKSTGIVTSFEEGNILHKELKPGQQLVTKQGDLWRWDGYCHTSKAKTPAEQILKRNRQLEKIKSEISKLNNSLKRNSLKIGTIKKELDLLQILNLSIEEKLLINRKKINNLSEKIELENNTLSKHIIQKNITETEYNMLKSSKLDLENLIKQIEKNIDKLIFSKKELLDNKTLEKKVIECKSQFKTKDSELTEILGLYHQKLSERNNQKEYNNNLLNEANRCEEQIKTINNRLAFLNKSRDKNLSSLLEYKDMPIRKKEERSKLLKEINQKILDKETIRNNLNQKDSLYEKTTKEYSLLSEKLAEFRENKARQEGHYEQAKQVIINNEEKIKEKLNIKPDEFDKILEFPLDKSFLTEEAEEKLEKLISRRERAGPVNLVAEKDASELENKINNIEEEKEEILDAINKLRTSIRSINKKSRAKLLEAFDDVNKHFKDLFKQLFGGGEAYLKLQGSDDPLESGLELMASPPGKKLQQLNLLSGGEKAITALALIFSVFLTKPSPICILDEVDAPLDDSNVDRFCDLLDKIINKCNTRFLIITHHRLTMARMDRLYGITMNEPGVSQLVSVSLKEAEFIKAAE